MQYLTRIFTYKDTTPFIFNAYPGADLSSGRLTVVLPAFYHLEVKETARIRYGLAPVSITVVTTMEVKRFKPNSQQAL